MLTRMGASSQASDRPKDAIALLAAAIAIAIKGDLSIQAPTLSLVAKPPILRL